MVLNGIPISDDECIGDSLATINSAFQTLSTTVDFFNVVDSPTIDLNWNASTRTLSAAANSSTLSTLLTSSLSAAPMSVKVWVLFHGSITTSDSPGLSYTRTSSTVTVTRGSQYAHGVRPGMVIPIVNATHSELNGNRIVLSAPNWYTFTFANPTTNTTSGNLGIDVFIKSSYNVNGVSKNGTGEYTITTAVDLPLDESAILLQSYSGFASKSETEQDTNNSIKVFNLNASDVVNNTTGYAVAILT